MIQSFPSQMFALIEFYATQLTLMLLRLAGYLNKKKTVVIVIVYLLSTIII